MAKYDDEGNLIETPTTGIEVDDDGNVIGTQNDARLAMFNRIADANDTDRATEFRDVNDDETTSEFVVQSSPTGEEEQGAVAPVVEKPTVIVPVVDTPAAKMYTLRINGVDQLVSEQEVLARAQKVGSADEYLREASRIRTELTERERLSKADASQASQAEDDLAIVRAIQLGTEEEAVAALKKLRSPQGPSMDDFVRLADARLDFKEALAKFRTDYVDITGDSRLNQMALDADAKLIANGDKRPYYERYKAIGDEIRNWVGVVTGSKTPVADPAVAAQPTKLERKVAAAKVAAVPKSAGSKTASSIEEDKEESVSDIIAGIAAKRGGPQWMSGMRH